MEKPKWVLVNPVTLNRYSIHMAQSQNEIYEKIKWTASNSPTDFVVVVQLLSCVRRFAIPWSAAYQASLSLPSPRVCPNSCPLNWWCHPTISSSVALFSFCLQSYPGPGSFPVSWLFASGSQRIGASASTSVLPMSIQCCFPLGLTGFISLLSEGLSRVFSSTTIRKHQFFSAQPSLWSNSHIRTWLLEKP